jgi:hypothetical protein
MSHIVAYYAAILFTLSIFFVVGLEGGFCESAFFFNCREDQMKKREAPATLMTAPMMDWTEIFCL